MIGVKPMQRNRTPKLGAEANKGLGLPIALFSQRKIQSFGPACSI